MAPNAQKIKSFQSKYKPIIPEIELARRKGRLEAEIENSDLPAPDPDHIHTHGRRLPSNQSLRGQFQTATQHPPTRNPDRAASPSSSPTKTASFSSGEVREGGDPAGAARDEVRRRRDWVPSDDAGGRHCRRFWRPSVFICKCTLRNFEKKTQFLDNCKRAPCLMGPMQCKAQMIGLSTKPIRIIVGRLMCVINDLNFICISLNWLKNTKQI